MNVPEGKRFDPFETGTPEAGLVKRCVLRGYPAKSIQSLCRANITARGTLHRLQFGVFICTADGCFATLGNRASEPSYFRPDSITFSWNP